MLFNPVLTLRHALSVAVSLLANFVCSCLRVFKDFSVSMREWASALASLRVFQTHSSATKTYWVTYIKIAKESHIYIYIYIRRSLAFNSKMCWLTYRGKVHLQGQEKVRLSHAPKSLYIFGEEKRLL